MKQLHVYKVILFSLVVLSSNFLRANDKIDNLDAAYKRAMKEKNIEHATQYICEAAKLDLGKYGKKCASMQRYTTEQLSYYDGFFSAGVVEFEHKNYIGSIRELKKISFGPHRDEAQRIIQEASNLLNHRLPPVDPAVQTIREAQAAYDSGNFNAALALALSIKETDLPPSTKEILNNIRVYNQAMDEGDAAMQSGKLAVAKQKYNFALVIKGNGPGNPSDKLRQIASQLATAPESPIPQKQDTSAVKIAPVAKQQNEKNKGKVAAKSASDIPKKITDFLVKAHDDEKKKNTSAAISDYEEVIALDPQQQEALAEKQRLTEAVQKDRNALEDTLIRGVRSYSQSHFEEARESLSHYLDEGGVRKGAAYFYLGAAFMAKALLLDAQNKTGYDNMQRNALRNFHLAKQEHFKPLEKYVSPKILAVWNQADS
jgi:hypothetical protein